VKLLRLTLLRHGQAESADVWAEDFDRPLTRRGHAEAREMAQRLVNRALTPDLILTSPADRTIATAEHIARAFDLDSHRLICARELYQASAEALWQRCISVPRGVAHILVCAHNPGLSDLASRLGPKRQSRSLPTGGLVTASWRSTAWDEISPQSAIESESDDPESMADLWA
jgi:phosphohistidine phosphatase